MALSPSRLLRAFTLSGLLALPLAGLLVSAPAMAQAAEPTTVKEIVAQVEATYKSVQSLKADFVQVSRSAAMGEGEKQRGRIQLMRPRLMRWDFTQPEVRLFVTDGRTMWVYSPSEKQVFVTEDLGTDAGGVDQLLSTLENLEEFFEVKLIDSPTVGERRVHVLELTPRKASGFKHLRIELTRGKYELERLVIVDAFDNETEMSFSNLKLNAPIASTEFTFQAPEGTQVVRADGM